MGFRLAPLLLLAGLHLRAQVTFEQLPWDCWEEVREVFIRSDFAFQTRTPPKR